MLSADVISSDAALNSFDKIGTLEFIAGEGFRLVIRLKQVQRADQLRYVVPTPDGTSLVTIYLPNKDGTTLDKICDFIVDDRSIWFCEITADESEELFSGNFTFDVDAAGDGVSVQKGFVNNGISLIVTGSCC